MDKDKGFLILLQGLKITPLPMRIAIYPGSFNPVHRGHVQLAREILNMQLADQVWMLVSPRNPLKINVDLAEEEHRFAITQLALDSPDRIIASDFEFTLPRPSYSVDTLKSLQSTYPEHQFVLLIGSDNALVFDQWKEYREILSLVDVYVYPRPGYPVREAISMYPSMKQLETSLYDISSTRIREMIQRGENTGEWLHPGVEKYIQEHQLYR